MSKLFAALATKEHDRAFRAEELVDICITPEGHVPGKQVPRQSLLHLSGQNLPVNSSAGSEGTDRGAKDSTVLNSCSVSMEKSSIQRRP